MTTELLLEDYRRRLNTALDAQQALPQTEDNVDTHKRFATKIGCYRTFISELEKIPATPSREGVASASAEDVLDEILGEDERKLLLHETKITKKHNGIEYKMIRKDLAIDAMKQFAATSASAAAVTEEADKASKK